MTDHPPEPIAVVGLSAIMPDAPDAATFWGNVKAGRYSISEVPPERWDQALYYDPDPRAPDKTYSRIGGWVREFAWDPMAWRLPIPPKVAEQLDGGQKWAVAGARSALLEAGWPGWRIEPERVGVILGNAIGGDKHYATALRIQFPEFARELRGAPSFAALPEHVRLSILEETQKAYLAGFPDITEDTMPGELSNILAGRIANLFNFRGPNFTTDAACASGLAATWAAIHGLNSHQYDAVVTGGIDRNMSVAAFVKFCKIGALSATGTRPFDAGADGFVMGEGAAIFVLKRLADAERDGDRIYAVLLGMAGSSDGKGKGITAPNPDGQRVAVEQAWRQAGVSPATASAVEAHGTSTRVGDAAELDSLTSVFLPAGAAKGSIALSSVKSNIGHLKAAAGAAGLVKMIMSLHEKVLPPSLNFTDPNPNIDWVSSPFLVNTELREWPEHPAGVRRGGVSAFGFGGTNFHAVLEEYVPGLHPRDGKRIFAAADVPSAPPTRATPEHQPVTRGALVVGGSTDAEVVSQLQKAHAAADTGRAPGPAAPDPSLAGARVRVAIDYGNAAELTAKTEKALKAFDADNPAIWKMLRSQGIFVGRGAARKVAFLYTGQGSQYVNMLRSLRDTEPIVEQTFAEADAIMTPLLGQPLSSYIFIDIGDPEAVKRLDQQLLQTEITQPAVLSADLALTRLLAAHGVAPDMVMGHSLGEYGALVAAGALDFAGALEAVSARGHEMANLQVADHGAMVAVTGPLGEIERIVAESDGYAVVANVNSNNQAVVGGSTDAVDELAGRLLAAGLTARRIPVSHAFHTSIVAPASRPLMEALRRLDVHAPRLPIVSNVTGGFYPENADVDTMVDLLGRQVASPVQFVRGLHSLYDAGARVFVEVGPKKALHGFVEDVLGSAHDDVLALFTNHPKLGDATSFNHALCGLYAAGIPLVLHYKTTTVGTRLPDRWGLPGSLQDDTGIIFASAFPGYDAFADYLQRYFADRGRRQQLAALEAVRPRMRGDEPATAELDRQIHELRRQLETEPFRFDRRFLLRCLSMGHSQFAEIIGARGPNTQLNAACASTTQAMCVAEDWIRAGRCRRVIVISADEVTSDALLPWLGSGFLASGAAATDDVVEDAAVPFDRRRHGLIIGMGAAAFVVEAAEAARERGIQPICEVLGAVTANSAFHGTRLDLSHISQVMEQVMRQAEARGVDRRAIAPTTVFVSHETYTPARGGSASAEINALRTVFGAHADDLVITNTKGFTGHAMGAGVEEVVAIKALETGIVPPIPNFKEPDPELGPLNLSKGGAYPVDYALRLAAGFGSQIAISLLHWTPMPDREHRSPDRLGFEYRIADEAAWRAWLASVSGTPGAQLEVVQRRLRIVDTAAQAAAPAEPALRTPAATAQAFAVAPAPAAPPPVAVRTVPQLEGVEGGQPEAPTDEAPTTAVSAAADPVTDAVVSIVSEMTGYPPDLLDLDLDLEADLGVDTVKQAEVFAAVRERFDVPRDESLKLRDFPTLAHVIGWIRERTGTSEAAPADKTVAEITVPEPSAAVHADVPIAGDIEATRRYSRRVPVPVVRPDLAACRPTGVTLGEGSRVVVMLDEGGVGKSLAGKLTNLGASTLVLDPGTATDELSARLDGWLADGAVQGVYWLPALDDEGAVADMDLGDWREALRRRVKNLYAVSRRVYDQAPFLVAATRLGGYHGYDDDGALAPLGGAVTGFVKAYKRECPETLVKVVDFPTSSKTSALADVLVEETLRDPGAVEVGHADGLRWTVGLIERPFGDGVGGLSLGADTVFVVTGAAGSIVSAITADLAVASAGTFHLLDLTPAPDPTDPDLRRFITDRDGLRSDIATRLRDRGERPTPVLIEKELARYERLHAALAAIQAVRDAGGTAHYHVVDLTDPEAVGRVMDEVRTASGHVDVVLHAAGLDVSRSLADKEPREYDLVFDVKSDGWFNVLRAAGDMPIGVIVAFSSIAGRFGNAGQTDYSAANDLLCKVVSNFRRTRKDTRAIALDWTAWSDIGMASRGSIPKIMEMAGIEMLASAAGIAWIRRELASGGDRGEVVVAGALGKLMEEYDETGGVDPGRVATEETGPMIGTVEAAGIHTGLVVRTTLDPKRQPFLNDHRIDGTAVLPGVMGVEGFAEVAQLLVPGWHVNAVEDVEFLAPVKFYRDEPRTLTLRATVRRDGTDLLAACVLEAERLLPGSTEPQRTTHFTASVRLTAKPPAEEHEDPVAESGAAVAASDVYRLYFHGSAYQVISSAWRHDGGDVARLAESLPANHDPAGLPTVLLPRLVELCFQAASLCEAGWYGRLALPRHVDKIQVLRDAARVPSPLYAVTRAADDHFNCAVLDAHGDVVVRVNGYRTTPLPGSIADEIRRPLAAVISTE